MTMKMWMQFNVMPRTQKGNRKNKAAYSNPAVVMCTLAASALIQTKCHTANPEQPIGTQRHSKLPNQACACQTADNQSAGFQKF